MNITQNFNLSNLKSVTTCYWRAAICLHQIACALCLVAFSTIIASAQNTSKPYIEDLSAYRPKFELKKDTSQKAISQNATDRPSVKPTKNVNSKLDAVLDSIDKQNLQKKFIDGFTIQLYSGQSKEEAMSVKQRVIEELANLTANLQYLQPKFRVSVGGYFSKLEAQKDLVRLKSFFPSAILVPEKIQVR
jgi:hypothetical protein